MIYFYQNFKARDSLTHINLDWSILSIRGEKHSRQLNWLTRKKSQIPVHYILVSIIVFFLMGYRYHAELISLNYLKHKQSEPYGYSL